jgi:hypothetical protein
MPPYTQRLYVDLIYKASGKYGIYDPPSRPLHPGDYGVITSTGAFRRDGNLYTLHGVALPEALTCPWENAIEVKSARVTSATISATART